jgi:hypothetical protein
MDLRYLLQMMAVKRLTIRVRLFSERFVPGIPPLPENLGGWEFMPGVIDTIRLGEGGWVLDKSVSFK